MMHRRNRQRNGTVIIAVLVTMLVVVSIAGTIMAISVRAFHETRVDTQLVQTQFLCEAGIARAVDLWQSDHQFEGDLWSPKLSQGSDTICTVISKITTSDNQQPVIEVIASIEGGPYRHRIQRTKTFSTQDINH